MNAFPETQAEKIVLLSTPEIAELTGYAASTVRSWLSLESNAFPKPICRMGRHFRWSKQQVLDWMQARGMEPLVAVEEIGTTVLKPPAGDRLLNTQQLAQRLGIQRSWLQESLRSGWLPSPDFAPGAPLPNFWLESTIDRWQHETAATH